MSRNAIARCVAALIGLVGALLLLTAATSAASGPALRLRVTVPDSVTAGEAVRIKVVATNVGDQPLSGDVTVEDTFPPELTGVTAASTQGASCGTAGQTMTCTQTVDGMLPGSQVRLYFDATVDPATTGMLTNHVEVSGGGTTGTLASDQSMRVGAPDPFGIRTWGVSVLDSAAQADARAGSHPAEIDTSFGVPTMSRTIFVGSAAQTASVEQFKDVVVHLPVGLTGVPTATPRCTAAQLAQGVPISPNEIPQCPQDSQVGIAVILGGDTVPIYNVAPPLGSPAAFGFEYESSTVLLTAKLRPSDNGIDFVERGTSTTIPVPAVDVTFWGVPADSSHDYVRHLCLNGYMGNNGQVCPTDAARVPFLRLPTSCPGTTLSWGVDTNSYLHPDTFVHADTMTPQMDGCQLLPFDPAFSLTPSTTAPHAPTGLDATVSLPQDNGPDGLAEADLRTSTVTLPDGMTINPSSADGLQACTDDQLNLRKDGTATCPDASKIGTVTLNTPLLDHPVGGSIFLRTQNSDDPMSGELFRIAVEIRSDDDGIDIKLPASIRADPGTGQLTTTFDDLPQLPFSTLQLHFKTGQRAPLVTPSTCGDRTTDGQFTPWSGTATVSISSPFSISGDAASCAGSAFADVPRRHREPGRGREHAVPRDARPR